MAKRPRTPPRIWRPISNTSAIAATLAAAASPLSRALIDATGAGTYERLAPLIAELDPTWTPTPHTTSSHRDPTTARPSTPSTTAAVPPADPSSSATVGDTADRNKIIAVVIKTAQVVRHPRRLRRG